MISYDENLIKEISRNCGSKSILEGFAYYRSMRHFHPETFWYDFHERKGYCVAYKGKKHARLIGIAVRSDCQGQGIGRRLFLRLISRAKQAGLSKVTFRTSIFEEAQHFYAKMGCNVVGLKDNDFEMEYIIK